MKQFKKLLSILLVLLMVCSFSACSASSSNAGESFPMELTDDYGNTLTLEKEPERIVSLSPSNTEILFALGAGEKVVGKTTSCNYPEEAALVEGIVGDYFNTNIESIIALEPDLVIGEYLDADQVNLLNNSGIAYYGMTYETIDKVYSNIETVGKLTNTYNNADEIVNEMKEKEDALVKKCQGQEEVSIFIDLGGFYSVNNNTLMGEMITKIGATNIVGEDENMYPQVSLETIIEKDPDIYISLGTPIDTLKQTSELNNTKAFKNNNVIFYEYTANEQDIIQRPSPRTIEGMELLAEICYPDLFK